MTTPEYGPHQIEPTPAPEDGGLAIELLRQKALAAYAPYIAAGFTSPDDLDLNETSVQQADEAFYTWLNAIKEEAGREAISKERNSEITMFYVDAGFRGSDYLDEVAHEFLVEDLSCAEQNRDTEFMKLIEDKIAYVEKLITPRQ